MELVDPTEDPRFRACLGDVGHVAFDVEAGERWIDHFPNSLGDDTFDRAGLVVVFPSGWPGVILGAHQRPRPGHADLCFWYGSPESAENFLIDPVGHQFRTIYGDVDVVGLTPERRAAARSPAAPPKFSNDHEGIVRGPADLI